MSLEVLRAGTRWDFESVPEFFAMLERQGVALNVAGFVGHSSVRTYVMGEDAPKRAATAAEIAKMKEIVLGGMRAGAIGFATCTSANHNGHGGIPMPSRLADDAELRALVGCLSEAGRGVFMLTKGGQHVDRSSSRSSRPHPDARSWSPRCCTTTPARARVFDDLDAIAAANARGRRMLGAVSCCPLTMDFTLHSPYTFEGLSGLEAGDGAERRSLQGAAARS